MKPRPKKIKVKVAIWGDGGKFTTAKLKSATRAEIDALEIDDSWAVHAAVGGSGVSITHRESGLAMPTLRDVCLRDVCAAIRMIAPLPAYPRPLRPSAADKAALTAWIRDLRNALRATTGAEI